MRKKGFKHKMYLTLRERDGLVCRLCGGTLENEWLMYEQWRKNMSEISGKKPFKRRIVVLSIDHKMPKSTLRKNGYSREDIWALENLQLAHVICNTKKGNSTLL